MSISPYFQSLLGGDLDAEELADDALLPRAIAHQLTALRAEESVNEDRVRYDLALRYLKIVGARANVYKAKKDIEDSASKAKIKQNLDLAIAVARTDAKLRRVPISLV